jgi:hypothetical protein
MRAAAAAMDASSRDEIDTLAPRAQRDATPSALIAPRQRDPPLSPESICPSWNQSLDQAITRSSASRVVWSAPRREGGARPRRAAAVQHFLANRHPDAFLEPTASAALA